MNHYNTIPGVLETGAELVSPHLRWLIRNAILEHCGNEAVNLIAYHIDIPKNRFGIANAPSRSICINLYEHFEAAMQKCMEDENMFASLRTLLIHELLDTAKHEAHHLLVAHETGNLDDSDLDEEGAKTAGKLSWMVAKSWDVQVLCFGEFLDEQINTFIASIKEDTKEKPTMWKDLQVYMHENNLGYYNPDKDMELSIMNTFEALAKDDMPWMNEPAKFLDTTIEESERTQVPMVPAVDDVPVQTYDMQAKAAPIEPVAPITPTPTSALEAAMAMFMQMQTAQQPVVAAQPSYGDEYPDYSYDNVPDSFEPEPVVVAAPVAPMASGMPVHDMAKIIETVMRTLFWHVVSKGEFTHEGGYNNPGVVMQPVSISHIPGALNIFTNMDTLDAQGKYAKNQPTNMGIKGMLTKEGLPKYTLFLNINGQLHRRSLVAQNPNAVDGQGQLKTWAREARAGSKIMYILGDDKNPGVRASIKLAAGSPLGQEEYKLWT